MEKIKITTGFIKLDQFLKWVGVAENGAHAKDIILNGKVSVNSEVETRRGKKIYSGDKVTVFDNEYTIE